MSWPRAFGLAAAIALAWCLAPRDRMRLEPIPSHPPADLQEWLARREVGIRPEVASYIQWAGQTGQITDIAILYVHGFSASPAELRPLPERVAESLGANLLAIRLGGHGSEGADLAAVSAQDWWRDLVHGLGAVRTMGRRVIVIGMSTGATLAAIAARDQRAGQTIDGLVLISPNFRLRARNAWVLDMPFMRPILRVFGDPQRCFQTRNDLHRARWTSCYPVSALLPVGAVLRQARRSGFDTARAPALFIWSDGDRIVDHSASAKVAAEWGGAATVVRVVPGPNDDPDAHVIAGEALSPDLTQLLIPVITRWIESLR